MSRIYAQATESVLDTSSSLAISASIGGSALSFGYTRLVGLFRTDGSAAAGAGSGLHITQSADNGVTWDLLSASQAIAACTSASCNINILGNAVRVIYWNGATAIASTMRASFRLYPI